MSDGAARARIAYCDEKQCLLEEFANAVKELMILHDLLFRALMDGDSEYHRFDLLIHTAHEKKEQAKSAYMRHAETHGC